MRHQVDARERNCRTDAELPPKTGARTARSQFRLVCLFNRSPRPFVIVEARFGRRQSAGRAHQQFDTKPFLQMCDQFGHAGCPTLRRRAAAENDPVSTTSTNASIAAIRSICSANSTHIAPSRRYVLEE